MFTLRPRGRWYRQVLRRVRPVPARRVHRPSPASRARPRERRASTGRPDGSSSAWSSRIRTTRSPTTCSASVYFHQGTLDLAIERYETGPGAGARFRALLLRPRSRVLPPRATCRRRSRRSGAASRSTRTTTRRTTGWRSRCFMPASCEQALEHFEQCTALTPEYLMARYHIGVIHERLGDLDAAEREFQRSLDEGDWREEQPVPPRADPQPALVRDADGSLAGTAPRRRKGALCRYRLKIS